MNILHIVPSYFPAYSHGGPIQSVHVLNKWLVKLGINVTVYTTNINGKEYLNVPLNKEISVDGVKVFYFSTSFRLWGYSFKMHKAIKENLKSFDIIHITSVFLSASLLGAHYAKKFKKPYIISPRGSLMKEPIKKKSSLIKKIYIALIERKNLRRASAIHFTLGQEEKEYKNQNFPVRKSIIIPNPFEFENFANFSTKKGVIRKKFGISEKNPIVLFLSRISWKKGFDTLIPAFAEVLKIIPDAKLLIAGGDEEGYKKNIQLLITNYQLQDKVIFTGMLTGDDKIAAYKDANVFVLPSYSENFGMAVVEALSIGLPVIVTEGVALSEIIKKEGVGVVIKKDVYELSRKIVDVLNHPDEFVKMSEKGKEFVAREFSPEVVAEKFIEVYKEIINSKN